MIDNRGKEWENFMETIYEFTLPKGYVDNMLREFEEYLSDKVKELRDNRQSLK